MTDDIVMRLRTWSADESTWDLLTEAADEIERLRAALHEWDALIEHQYSGSREAMSDMTYAARHTAHLLHGDEPWPMQTRVEKLEAALQRVVHADGVTDEIVETARAALEGVKSDG
jgi:DNA repair ATPase RecN